MGFKHWNTCSLLEIEVKGRLFLFKKGNFNIWMFLLKCIEFLKKTVCTGQWTPLLIQYVPKVPNMYVVNHKSLSFPRKDPYPQYLNGFLMIPVECRFPCREVMIFRPPCFRLLQPTSRPCLTAPPFTPPAALSPATTTWRGTPTSAARPGSTTARKGGPTFCPGQSPRAGPTERWVAIEKDASSSSRGGKSDAVNALQDFSDDARSSPAKGIYRYEMDEPLEDYAPAPFAFMIQFGILARWFRAALFLVISMPLAVLLPPGLNAPYWLFLPAAVADRSSNGRRLTSASCCCCWGLGNKLFWTLNEFLSTLLGKGGGHTPFGIHSARWITFFFDHPVGKGGHTPFWNHSVICATLYFSTTLLGKGGHTPFWNDSEG